MISLAKIPASTRPSESRPATFALSPTVTCTKLVATIYWTFWNCTQSLLNHFRPIWSSPSSWEMYVISKCTRQFPWCLMTFHFARVPTTRQEETQGVNLVRRRPRLSASGSQDPEADVRKHAFRPPRLRKSQRTKCSADRGDEDFDNYDEDDEDRGDSSILANNSSTDFKNNTSAGVGVSQGQTSPSTGAKSCEETHNKNSSNTPIQSNSGSSPSGSQNQSTEAINARIDHLSR